MRPFWTAVLALAAAAAAAFYLLPERSPWTTPEAEARSEFERGLEADMKLYHQEASEHFHRAAELDPSFVAAKLHLVLATRRLGQAPDEALVEDVRAADLDRLSPRERFLVRLHLAGLDGEVEERDRILAAYLEERPEDPWALHYACGAAWGRQDWAEAEECYRRLLQIDPNWVLAQNHLGYIAMAQGRFEEARSHFETYRYIAPDQANPHDSLGELLTVLGRYEEAESALREALRIRPDFCASWLHLIDLALLRRDAGAASEVLSEAERRGACSPRAVAAQHCRIGLWDGGLAGDWDRAWQAASAVECIENAGEIVILGHRAAVLSGRRAEALALEDRIADSKERHYGHRDIAAAMLHHMRGVRLAADGLAVEAARAFADADAELAFWGEGLAVFKLFNRLDLASALRAAGEDDAADRALAELRDINPELEARFPTFGAPKPLT